MSLQSLVSVIQTDNCVTEILQNGRRKWKSCLNVKMYVYPWLISGTILKGIGQDQIKYQTTKSRLYQLDLFCYTSMSSPVVRSTVKYELEINKQLDPFILLIGNVMLSIQLKNTDFCLPRHTFLVPLSVKSVYSRSIKYVSCRQNGTVLVIF